MGAFVKPESFTMQPVSPDTAKAGVISPFGKDLSATAFIRALVLLSLLGLVVRIGFYVEHANSPSFGVPTLDEKYYDTVARMLLTGANLHELHAFRPLLYPMFLAFFYKLGGNWGLDLAVLAQHLLGIATGVLVALLGARLFRHRLAGLAGGVLFLLAPLPLCFEGDLLIESSYTFLIFLALLLHFYTATLRGWRSALFWLVGGSLIALASQARANILVFLAVYPLFAAWRWWHTRERSALLPLLGLAGALAMMIVWGFVNLQQADRFHLMTNAGGVNFYFGNRRGANGMFGHDVITALSELSQSNKVAATTAANEHYEDLVEVWAREEYAAAMRAQHRPVERDSKAVSRYWTQRTLDEIKADPAAWARLLAKKCWLMLWNTEVPNNKNFAFLQEEFLWLRLLPVRWVVLLMLAPAGLWAATRFKNRDDLFILLVYIGFYSAGNVAFFICDRYRYPIWPAMAVLAGGGLLAGLDMLRRRQWRKLLSFLACAALMAAISLPNWFGAKLPNFSQDLYFRSSAWYKKGRFAEALKDINRSVELDPYNAAALEHRGNVLFALNRLKEASRAYEQALKLIPGDSGAWNNLGATLEAQGDMEAALRAYHRATQCNPPSPSAYLGIAFIQIRAGRLEEATSTLAQLSKLQGPPRAATFAAWSVIERRRGNIGHADALEQQARQLDAAAAAWAIERATNSPAHSARQKHD